MRTLKKYIAPKSEIVNVGSLMSGAGFDWTNSEAEQWGKENDTLIDDDEDITNISSMEEDVEFNEDQWEE